MQQKAHPPVTSWGPDWPLYNYMQIHMSSDTDPDIADIPGELADELNRLPDEE